MKEKFEFSEENLSTIKEKFLKYPKGKERSAIIDMLYLAQKQNNNYLPKEAIDAIAGILSIAPIRVYEVASFYSMFNFNPVGENFIQICTTTPCYLRGAEDIVNICKNKLNTGPDQLTTDNKFSYRETECLGACVNGPVIQINDDYYEDLTPEIMLKLIENLDNGYNLQKGSQIGRQCSAPIKNNKS